MTKIKIGGTNYAGFHSDNHKLKSHITSQKNPTICQNHIPVNGIQLQAPMHAVTFTFCRLA